VSLVDTNQKGVSLSMLASKSEPRKENNHAVENLFEPAKEKVMDLMPGFLDKTEENKKIQILEISLRFLRNEAV